MLSPTASVDDSLVDPALRHAEALVRGCGAFRDIERRDNVLRCRPADAPDSAWYALSCDRGRLWVSLTTPDRYLSQSIEQDLVHTGDKLDDLLEEELVDLGCEIPGGRGALRFEHFRSESKEFTFRTPLPIITDPAAPATRLGELGATFLRAYEACFRRLGGMAGEQDE